MSGRKKEVYRKRAGRRFEAMIGSLTERGLLNEAGQLTDAGNAYVDELLAELPKLEQSPFDPFGPPIPRVRSTRYSQRGFEHDATT